MRALIPSVNERWNGPLGWFFLLWLLVQPEIMAEDTKRVVLTFDDSKASHYTTVRPILLGLGFNATFFITEGFTFASNKDDYMTWEQIAMNNGEVRTTGFVARVNRPCARAELTVPPG